MTRQCDWCEKWIEKAEVQFALIVREEVIALWFCDLACWFKAIHRLLGTMLMQSVKSVEQAQRVARLN